MIYKIETYDNQVYIIESVNGIEKTIENLQCTEWHIFNTIEGSRISIRERDIKRVTLLKK
jgi:hypothetical protein